MGGLTYSESRLRRYDCTAGDAMSEVESCEVYDASMFSYI